MNNFDDITLLPIEYKTLKKCNRAKGFFTCYKQVKALRDKNLICPEKISELSKSETPCLFHTTDKGKRYIAWHKAHFIKWYYPIVISFFALGVSVIHILLEIVGVI